MQPRNPSKLSPKRIAGYTLVELMIAMSIGLFLIGGSFQITQTNKKSTRLQKNLQQTQNNGRFAINNLSYAIKTAGYSGFYMDLSDGVENLINTPTDAKWDISTPVSGFNNVANSKTIAGVTGFIPNTDVLLLKGMESDVLPVFTNNDSSTIEVSKDNNFSNGDIVVITDTDQASLFQIGSIATDSTKSTLTLTTGGSTPGNATLLSNSFNSESQISLYSLQLYYIKAGMSGEPALFTTSLSNSSGTIQVQEKELVSNIDNMQLNYGIDNNDDQVVDEYKDASTITNWSQVVSINVALLASSHGDNIVPKKSSYSYDADLVTFVADSTPSNTANKRLKRIFRTYIPLRN